MSFDYQHYGSKIKQFRKTMKYSQKYVYEMTGISIETQRLLENGHREPRLGTLERLSELYKVDLIHELLHSRKANDFFSENFLNDIQNLINTFDYDGFIAKIENLIENIKKEYLQDTLKSTKNMKFIEFLEAFKDQELFNIRYSMHNAAFFEQLLLYFSRNKSQILADRHLYYLEIQMAMMLAVIYRQADDFDKSEEILETLIRRLGSVEDRTTRQNDYFVVAHINLSYLYNRRNQYTKVLKVIDDLFEMNDVRIKRTHLLDLLNRKAVALYRLGCDDYKGVWTTVFHLSTESEAQMQYKILEKVFDINAADFVDMDYIKGNPATAELPD